MGKNGIRSIAGGVAPAALIGASIAGLGLVSASAQDQQVAAADAPRTVTVTGSRRGVQSPKYTAPLLDTPQTITVVDDRLIAEQNLLGLRDILSTLPGITFGAGEGGGGYGDSINLRGFSANNDITVDGVRDSAQYSRTDPFNLEQVEVVSGPNSVYSGAGSVGGTINLVTKRPHGTNDTIATVAGGTDEYGRATVDADHLLTESIAVRANLMIHQNDAPGRDVEEYERWAIAPGIAFGVGGQTQFTALYVHQEDENTPQYGVPFALNAFNNGPLPGVDPSDYFGYRNVDTQDITVDSASLIFEHAFNETLSVRNLARWQRVAQLSIVDAPSGTFCLFSGIDLHTGAACGSPGTLTVTATGPRGNVRDTVNEALVNQTDLRASFQTGALKHTMVIGAAFSNETYHLDTGNILRNPLGATPNPALPVISLSNPNSIYTGPLNFIRTGYTDSEVNNRAVYAFDDIEFTPQWSLNGGIRFEHNEGKATVATIATPYPAPPASPVITQNPVADNSADLLSYRAGIVYKPVPQASIYFAYGNSETPSQSTVNGACTLTSATGTANCNVDPEEAVSYEVGVKWNALSGSLQLTAAAFRNDRTNFRVNSGDPLVPQQQLDGESRVDGIALGVAGVLAEHWSIYANYTYLHSEVLQGISDIAIGGGTIDFVAGDPLPQTPEHSFSFWTTYETPYGIVLGYGTTYQGKFTFARFTATSPLFYTDEYWVHRAMIAYKFNDRAALQLNVNNIFDEDYYVRIRNNATSGWATPGDTLNAVLSLSYRF